MLILAAAFAVLFVLFLIIAYSIPPRAVAEYLKRNR